MPCLYSATSHDVAANGLCEQLGLVSTGCATFWLAGRKKTKRDSATGMAGGLRGRDTPGYGYGRLPLSNCSSYAKPCSISNAPLQLSGLFAEKSDMVTDVPG